MDIEAFVLNHYRASWGEPALTQRYPLAGAPDGLLIATYEREDERGPWWVYATVGLCAHTLPAGEHRDHRRIEMIVYAYAATPKLTDTLAGLANYPFQANTFLDIGHLVRGTHGVIDGSPLTDILFLPALHVERELRLLHLDEKVHAEILWMVPLHRSERLFAREHGWRALLDLFIEHESNAQDFQRPPVV